MSALLDWFDDRTGIRDLTHAALYEHIPGGSRWRYVWGSTLVFTFAMQVITGLFLWMCYSPSSQTAWESVYFIQHEMQGGWLLRGLHHFTAQAMIVLLALHLLQVVVDGAYRAPREVNFWLGLVLLKIVLGLSLTGYLLPWDQKGYWATRVATNLTGIVPAVGPAIQKVVVGGADYGHQTLTRFFALHAGVLPCLLVFFLVLHIALFRRHGIHTRPPYARPDTTFWPDQVLKDAVACLAVLVFVLFFVVRPALTGSHAGQPYGDYLGAELGAPADPSNEYSAARPEWYFLFLFQFLKLFQGGGGEDAALMELIGAIVIPGLILFVLALMPLVGRWKLGHWFNLGFLVVLFVGIGALTGLAIYDDRVAQYRADVQEDGPAKQKMEASRAYLKAVSAAESDAHRALVLARAPEGIPPTGMLSVMRKDAKSQGPRLFARYCASCHTHADSTIAPAEPSAPDLTSFASRDWLTRLLDPDEISGPHYFGGTKHKDEPGGMVEFVKDSFPKTTDQAKERKREEAAAQIAAAISAEAALPAQRASDRDDAALISAGRRKVTELGCTDCHKYRDEGDLGPAPDLTGYGSSAWLKGMIGNPGHERFYGENNDRMPAFAVNERDPGSNIISPANLNLLIRWLRGDWYEPPQASSVESGGD